MMTLEFEQLVDNKNFTQKFFGLKNNYQLTVEHPVLFIEVGITTLYKKLLIDDSIQICFLDGRLAMHSFLS